MLDVISSFVPYALYEHTFIYIYNSNTSLSSYNLELRTISKSLIQLITCLCPTLLSIQL